MPHASLVVLYELKCRRCSAELHGLDEEVRLYGDS